MTEEFNLSEKEKDELIIELQDNLSNEIYSKQEEIKGLEAKNKYLWGLIKDYQKNFERDKKLFKDKQEEIDKLSKEVLGE